MCLVRVRGTLAAVLVGLAALALFAPGGRAAPVTVAQVSLHLDAPARAGGDAHLSGSVTLEATGASHTKRRPVEPARGPSRAIRLTTRRDRLPRWLCGGIPSWQRRQPQGRGARPGGGLAEMARGLRGPTAGVHCATRPRHEGD